LHYGIDIRALWNNKEYVEEFILALNHSEVAITIRAAKVLKIWATSEP